MSQSDYYRGIRMIRYDLVKELVIALGVVVALVLVLSAFLSSPDEPPVTIQSWSQADPVDFVTTATGELAGTTTSAAYGHPYNETAGSGQSWGFVSPQNWFPAGVPVDSAYDFVIQPLTLGAGTDPNIQAALQTWESAGSDQQTKWLNAYSNALNKASFSGGQLQVPGGADYGPLPDMMTAELMIARTGGLDGLLTRSGHFFQTDYTKPLLFMGDGGYLAGLAGNENLAGNQWGMMNETGSYPGQTWLWLYTFWYQIPPFTSSSGFLGVSGANADLAVVAMMTVLTLLLALVPFIPVLRDIPRWIPIHRLIWRSYYREQASPGVRSRAATV